MIFPPADFEQLRQLSKMLRQGEVDLPIGKKSLLALERMIVEPHSVATNNIVELSAQLTFSPASITRLAKLLGFQGFNQFKLLFKQKNSQTNSFYSDQVENLLANKNQTSKETLQSHFQQTLSASKLCLDQIKQTDLDKAIHLLSKKHRIFIFGYRQSSAIANILRYGLALLRPNVQLLVQADHGAAVALGQLKKDDLLVVVGSAPYSNITVNIAKLAHKQQCTLFAITDTHLSPLNDYAELAMHIPTTGQYYANSLVSQCIFIESLLCLTAMELGQSAINNLTKHQQLLAQLDESG